MRINRIKILNLLIVTGFFLPIYPEFSVLVFLIGNLYFIITNKFRKKSQILILFALNLIFVLFAFFHNFLIVIVFIFSIFIFFQFLEKIIYNKQFYIGLIIGTVIILIFVMIQKLGYLNEEIWQPGVGISEVKVENGNVNLYPLEKYNAGITKNLNFQGSGIIKVRIVAQAKHSFKINMSILHEDLIDKRKNLNCELQVTWSVCEMKVYLPSRKLTTFIFGGYGTWKASDSVIQVRDFRILSSTSPGLIERFVHSSRVFGLAFNSNAFGAQMAVVTILTIAFLRNIYWILFFGLPGLACIFLSGSRGALISFVLGCLVLLLVRSRFLNFLPLLFVILLIGVPLSQTLNIRYIKSSEFILSESYFLSNGLGNTDSALDRLEIWRLASKVWLNSPQSFLFGVGDFQVAIKKFLKTHPNTFNLNPETITHAHNLWLQVAGESGVLGLFLMFWLWGWAILRAWRSRDSIALSLLATIIVVNSFDYLFFYAPIHCVFWMCVAGFHDKLEQDIDLAILFRRTERKTNLR